jgi:hypothetical protein
MNLNNKRLSRWRVYVVTTSVLFAACACTSVPNRAEEKSAEKNSPAAQAKADPGIDLNCIVDHIQNPVDSFHYSYKKDGPNSVNEEADITPQSIDGSFKNDSISQPVHGVRSDKDSWRTASTGLMGISGMSSTVALVNHNSAMVPEGAEKMNGYDATRYSIDTTRGNAAEAALYTNTLGEGGFEKGTAWVTSQGCPVKLSLDSELHLRNGSIEKVHYEIEMAKK